MAAARSHGDGEVSARRRCGGARGTGQASRDPRSLSLAVLGATAAPGRREGRRPRPNVIVVLTDDQTYESLDRMPYVNGRDDWIRFKSACVNTPTCCPSRTTLLNGRYSHHNGVLTNFDSRKVQGKLDDRDLASQHRLPDRAVPQVPERISLGASGGGAPCTPVGMS